MPIQDKYAHRLLELDVLRGLAALMVLCFHSTTDYTNLYSPNFPPLFKFPFGRYGVDLFFMISGFVILMTLEKTKRPLDFIVSRFSRLYPCYWAAIILTFCVVNLSHLPLFGSTLKEALINLTMFQSWLGVHNVDDVYWTLTVELSFYSTLFLFFLTGKLKYIEIGGLVWIIVMVWYNKFSLLFHIHMPWLILQSGLLHFGHLFLAGILFYNLKTKGHAWYRHVGLILCFVVQYIFRTDLGEPLLVGLFFVVFYLFIYGKMTWCINRPLLYLGSISYSLYLTHRNIGYVMIRYLYSIHANAFIRFMVPMLCAILIASVISYCVEKPALEYIRQKYLDWRQKKKNC